MLSACKETIFTAINDYAYSQGMNKLYQNHKIDIQLPYQATPYLHLQRSALDIIKSNNLCIELIFAIYTRFLNPAHNELFIFFISRVCLLECHKIFNQTSNVFYAILEKQHKVP